MRWISKELRLPNQTGVEIDVCWFYPWKYQDREDVWKGLIAEVILATITQDDREPDAHRIVAASKRFAGFLGAGFVQVLSSLTAKVKVGGVAGPSAELGLSVGEVIDGFKEAYGKHLEPQKAYYNVFEQEITRWIEENYRENRRMVVFIDDLDRCMPDIALQVLEALKLYLNISNLVFIVGVDKAVIDGIVHKRYCDHFGTELSDEKTRERASQYLDKMFQVEVNVQPDENAVRKFQKELLQGLAEWDRLEEANRTNFEYVLRRLSGLTPRTVIRTINLSLVHVQQPDDVNGFTEAVWFALVELVLRSLPNLSDSQRLAMRTDDGRDFFETWRRAAGRDSGKTASTKSDRSADSGPREPEPDRELSLAERVERSGLGELLEPRFAPYWSLTENHLLITLAKTKFGAAGEPEVPELSDEEFFDLLSEALDVARSEVEEVVAGRDQLSFAVDAELGIPLLRALSKRHPGLMGLDLGETQISDAGLEWVSKFSNLTWLSLAYTRISDAGLERVSKLTNLTQLDLGETQISDAGLEWVSKLTNLTQLDLARAQISDAGLEWVSKLQKLEVLYLSSGSVTAKAIDALRATRPGLHVFLR